ncbi:MAG TPA: 16S rRNA (cytidine(1402)-2'-O)-methyltransferase [Candidatus Paceibacterota bacterium]|nr:16S rRNA (cytidine(1402)-2'-O)-methyltransferase [Candidatus Paceibacterota bacterium]
MEGTGVGKLSIVATPIGNLEDITLRALRTLKEAAVIYCEDTRVTSKLLARYELHTPLKRLDANVEASKAVEVVERLQKGEHVAYVSDAGTPTISDPGYRLVAAVQKELGDSVVEAIPGASALVAALSISGIAADEFLFLGFPPHKKGRQTLLKRIASTEGVVVLYESSHRILKLLEEFADAIPARNIVVAREITKKFENVQRGVAVDLLAHFEKETGEVRGEFVVIVEAE